MSIYLSFSRVCLPHFPPLSLPPFDSLSLSIVSNPCLREDKNHLKKSSEYYWTIVPFVLSIELFIGFVLFVSLFLSALLPVAVQGRYRSLRIDISGPSVFPFLCLVFAFTEYSFCLYLVFAFVSIWYFPRPGSVLHSSINASIWKR